MPEEICTCCEKRPVTLVVRFEKRPEAASGTATTMITVKTCDECYNDVVDHFAKKIIDSTFNPEPAVTRIAAASS